MYNINIYTYNIHIDYIYIHIQYAYRLYIYIYNIHIDYIYMYSHCLIGQRLESGRGDVNNCHYDLSGAWENSSRRKWNGGRGI